MYWFLCDKLNVVVKGFVFFDWLLFNLKGLGNFGIILK